MAEKPIIYSGWSVRAILENRKRQTRRVVKLLSDPPERNGDRYDRLSTGCWHVPDGAVWENEDGQHYDCKPAARCPYPVGTRLWVRETWATRSDLGKHVEYRASHQEPAERPFAHIYDEKTRWRSPMFMPRWASRITLEVTDVRVQRVQEISAADAVAEGVMATEFWTPDLVRPCRAAFRKLWDSLNAKRGFGWDSNPWVWAYTFKVLEVRR